MTARSATIRSRAAALSAGSVPIEVEDDDGASQTQPPNAATSMAPEPDASAPPPPTAPPQPPAPTAPQQQQEKNLADVAPAVRSQRIERRLTMVLTSDKHGSAIRTLDNASRKLKDSRSDRRLKGQLGATLLFIMGLRLLEDLSDDELFELARTCATYQ